MSYLSISVSTGARVGFALAASLSVLTIFGFSSVHPANAQVRESHLSALLSHPDPFPDCWSDSDTLDECLKCCDRTRTGSDRAECRGYCYDDFVTPTPESPDEDELLATDDDEVKFDPKNGSKL